MSEKTKKVGWEHFSHQADIGIRGFGQNIQQAFAQAALAMTAVITDPDKVTPKQMVKIQCSDPDIEILFVEWLNCLVYEMDTRKMLFSKFDITIQKNRLTAQVWGQKIDLKTHQPAVEVKAASYTELKVCQKSNSTWIAQCVVDV